jgi:hypothetical protein
VVGTERALRTAVADAREDPRFGQLGARLAALSSS